MNVAASFVPGTERSGRDVVLDALGRTTEKGIFPVMDGAGAIGGQVSDPVAHHHPFERERSAVANQMSAIDQHHARATQTRARNRASAFANRFDRRITERAGS